MKTYILIHTKVFFFISEVQPRHAQDADHKCAERQEKDWVRTVSHPKEKKSPLNTAPQVRPSPFAGAAAVTQFAILGLPPPLRNR